jgi:hypothetical protein
MTVYANDAAEGMGWVPSVFNNRIFEFNRQIKHRKKHVLNGTQNRIDILYLQSCSLIFTVRFWPVFFFSYIGGFAYDLTFGLEPNN